MNNFDLKHIINSLFCLEIYFRKKEITIEWMEETRKHL